MAGEQQKKPVTKKTRPAPAAHSQNSLSNRKVPAAPKQSSSNKKTRQAPEQNSSNKKVQTPAATSSAAPNSSKKRTRSAPAKKPANKRARVASGQKSTSEKPPPLVAPAQKPTNKRTPVTTKKKSTTQMPPLDPAQSSSASDSRGSTSAPAPTPALDNDKLFISVVGENDHKMHFKLYQDTPMELLKTTYAKKLGLGSRVTILRFLFDGRRIVDSDTPKTLDMADGDIIEAYREQTGGTF